MTTILLAMGVFGSSGGFGGSSDVETPTARTIRFTQNGTSFIAAQALDPTDILDYELDLSALLDDDEAMASVTLVVVPAAAALGFELLSDPPYEPEEVDNSHIRVWANVDVASRGLSAWSGSGTLCSIEITATTDSTPPRVWQRTAKIRVAQR